MSTLAAALLFALSATNPAQEGIPDKTLKTLKEATVFVKLETAGLRATGSGFLMKKDGDAGFIVTNAHVINSEGRARRVSVVFSSGTREERTAEAQVMGEDSSRDLAILRVDLKNLPAPIDLSVRVKPRETLPVYMVGFPFGEALSTGKGNPAVTVGRGSVSSIRLDEFGNLAVIQIDGDLNPGNSGGPIVDAKGALVGVAVAKVMGTQIGLAIPPGEIEELMSGRVQGVSMSEIENKAGSIRFKAEMTLIDPMHRMKSVAVLLVPRSKVKTEPKADEKGLWGVISSDAKENALKIDGDHAAGEFVVRNDAGEDVVYLMQTRYVRGDGRTVFTQPGDLQANFSAGMAKKAENKPAPGKDTPKGPAGDDWLGTEMDKKKKDAADSGKPVDTGEILKGEAKTVVDATVWPIKVDSRNTIPSMQWSEDGKILFTLETRGLVRRISTETFTEERQLLIGRKCNWMDRSKDGLLVLVQDLQEIWVLDEEKLTVKKKIPCGKSMRMTASPATGIAFAGNGRDELTAVDTSSGKSVREFNAFKINADQGKKIKRHKDGVVLSEFGMPTLTPDGKYLFCVGFECLHRFKVSGNDLVYEEMGPRIGQNPQRIEISPDSKYVALPSGGGNYNISDHPQIGSYGTYVYRVSDLQMPIMSISSGAYPRTLQFDRQAGLVYAENHERCLITFTPKGLKEKEYQIEGSGEPRQFLVHPQGKKLLILSEPGLFWVELAK
jgi:hypothetical protein